MNSYQRSDRRGARRRLAIATVVVILAFVIDLASGGMLRAAARGAGSSLWSFGAAAGNALFGQGYFSSKRALSAEIESLRRTLAERESMDGRLDVLEAENAELRAIVKLSADTEGITAPIISSNVASPYGTFSIGVGIPDGVRVGDIVLAGSARGFVLGRIADARAKSALVKELFAPGEQSVGYVGKAELSLEGRGGGNARAEAPEAISIAAEDVVTSPQFGNRVIGIVGAVSKEQGSGLMRVFVRAPAHTTDLHIVYVVRTLE